MKQDAIGRCGEIRDGLAGAPRVRRHLLDLAILLASATIACSAISSIAQPRDPQRRAARRTCSSSERLMLLAIVSSPAIALPRRRRSPFDDSARARRRTLIEQPAQVEQIERAVTLGVATAHDLHLRLLPQLREIARCRLERAGRDLGPETLGRWWELLRPDRRAARPVRARPPAGASFVDARRRSGEDVAWRGARRGRRRAARILDEVERRWSASATRSSSCCSGCSPTATC